MPGGEGVRRRVRDARLERRRIISAKDIYKFRKYPRHQVGQEERGREIERIRRMRFIIRELVPGNPFLSDLIANHLGALKYFITLISRVMRV